MGDGNSKSCHETKTIRVLENSITFSFIITRKKNLEQRKMTTEYRIQMVTKLKKHGNVK